MKVVDNREARVHFAEHLMLKPGKNILSDDQVAEWEKAKKNPIVQHYLESEVFVEEGFDAKSPADLDEAEVIAIVKETLDVDVLEAMHKTETRAGVLKVIDAQLAKVGPTEEQKKKLAEAAGAAAKNVSEAKAQTRAKKAEQG